MNNLIPSEYFEGWAIWNYGQKDFNNIFQFLQKSAPVQQ